MDRSVPRRRDADQNRRIVDLSGSAEYAARGESAGPRYDELSPNFGDGPNDQAAARA